MINNKLLLLKSYNYPVSGYFRGIIYNLLNNSYFFIPVKYSNLLSNSYIIERKDYSDEAIDFFLNNNLVFEINKNNISNFPNMKFDYIPKYNLENLIIEIDHQNISLLKDILTYLLNYNIKSIELLFNDTLINYNIANLITEIKKYIDSALVINIPYPLWKKSYNKINLNVIVDYLKVYNVNNQIKLDRNVSTSKYSPFEIYYWIMSKNKLFFNLDSFSEALKFHSIFNRQIFISKKGIIKNSPIANEILGIDIFEIIDNNLDILELISDSNLLKLWKLKKDDIDICKDCEFRYMCLDGRVPNKENKFDDECPYNPYIGLWKDEKGWISVEQWRKENPDWEEKAKANRATYKKENCEENLKEEKEYFNKL